MRSAVRTLGELGDNLVLAPERHLLASAASAASAKGTALGDLVIERRERIEPASEHAMVVDTTHARDGILDVAGALRDAPPAKSAKKRAHAGDVLVSRLRPYLRQVAYVHPGALAMASGRAIAVSTEFYVLASRDAGGDVAWLVPFLLSAQVQAALAAAQEGGHHPRVPRDSLLALRVPDAVLASRAATSRAVRAALADLHRGAAALASLVAREYAHPGI